MNKSIDNRAYFGGDAWEYHSAAVNFACCNRFMNNSQLLTFDKYKFNTDSGSFEEGAIKLFHDAQDRIVLYRTPLWPVILGSLYKLIGINPVGGKIFNIFIFCLASTMFIQHFNFGNLTGRFLSVAGFTLVFRNFLYEPSTSLLTEPLIYFMSMSYVIFLKKLHIIGARYMYLLFAFFMILLMLTKGLFIFIPFLTYIYMYWNKDFSRSNVNWSIGVFLFLLFSWSFFATLIVGKLTLISDQGAALLFSGNNEFAWRTGGWSPVYEKAKDSFYNRHNFTSDSSFVSYFIPFVKEFYYLIPVAIFQKLKVAFFNLPALLLFLFYAFNPRARSIVKDFFRSNPDLNIYIINLLLLSLIGFGDSRFTIVLNLFWFLLLVNVLLTYKDLDFLVSLETKLQRWFI